MTTQYTVADAIQRLYARLRFLAVCAKKPQASYSDTKETDGGRLRHLSCHGRRLSADHASRSEVRGIAAIGGLPLVCAGDGWHVANRGGVVSVAAHRHGLSVDHKTGWIEELKSNCAGGVKASRQVGDIFQRDAAAQHRISGGLGGSEARASHRNRLSAERATSGVVIGIATVRNRPLVCARGGWGITNRGGIVSVAAHRHGLSVDDNTG